MAELKPCPFCGISPELILENKIIAFNGMDISVRWVVNCPKCHTKKVGQSTYEFTFDEQLLIKGDGKRAVIETWNRRASDG